MAGKLFGSSLKMMSSVTRNAGRSVRHVNTSSLVPRASFQVQTEEEFHDKVMKGDKPVVVDFSATWCGPCKLLLPRLEAAITNAEDEVTQYWPLIGQYWPLIGHYWPLITDHVT